MGESDIVEYNATQNPCVIFTKLVTLAQYIYPGKSILRSISFTTLA